jgi:hypothetical protein
MLSVGHLTLGKEVGLPSADARHSAKITAISYRQRLTTLCRASLFAEWLALGKAVFAECLPMPSVQLLVNVAVTESKTLLSVALSKYFFAECPTKNIPQRAEFR